jgi:hypothetical protein
MSLLLQQLLVALLVVACALYAAWRLMSGRSRLACLKLLGTLPGARRSRWHAALSRRTLARLSGCAGCAPLSPGRRAPNQTPGAPRR